MNRRLLITIFGIAFFSAMAVIDPDTILFSLPMITFIIVNYFISNRLLDLYLSLATAFLAPIFLSNLGLTLLIIPVLIPIYLWFDLAIKSYFSYIPSPLLQFKSLYTTSIFLVTIIVASLFLSIFNASLLFTGVALALHLIYNATILRRGIIRRIEIKMPGVVRGISEEESMYTIEFYNPLRHRVMIQISLETREYYRYSIEPGSLYLEPDGAGEVAITLRPLKSGKYPVELHITLSDEYRFVMMKRDYIVELEVTPRLEVAIRAARQLIARLSIMTEVLTGLSTSIYKVSRGGEYYGIRPYVPSDDIRSIYWKKSVEKQELVVKEYIESKKSKISVLVELESPTPDEMDRQLYEFISTLISVTLEDPSAEISIAAYNSQDVYVYPSLTTYAALLRALDLIKECRVREMDRPSLDPPNIGLLLRAMREESLVSEVAMMELVSLKSSFEASPAYKALKRLHLTSGEGGQLIFIYPESRSIHIYSYLKFYAGILGYTVVEPEKLPPRKMYLEAKYRPIPMRIS
jgi:hypothetical protein